MDSVMDELIKDDNNVSVTENGALGYRTTGKALLDLNFAVASLRNATEKEIEAKFAAACGENLPLAITWMFMARDLRGSGTGMGERRLFRVCFRYLAREWPSYAVKLLSLIPFYGRWDDLIDLVFTSDTPKVADEAFKIVRSCIDEDYSSARRGESVSLLAKWMPSENASARETILRAKTLQTKLGMTPRYYRRMLSACRKAADVVERKMSANQWGEIDYSAVPSRANLIYKDAFQKHDPNRRSKFLEKVASGDAKINAAVLFPHEIVGKYKTRDWHSDCALLDESLEALWKALPNTIPDGGSVLVVADGSGSMCCNNHLPINIAHALSIYFAERLPEPWKNHYITFSADPEMVDLSGANTLCGKLQIADSHDDCSNTDIEKTFDLILDTAVHHDLKQDDLPKNILIISDMEFDAATMHYECDSYFGHYVAVDSKLFDTIANRWAVYGYKLPRLVFWNVASRTGTIPVTENELGVALVSGYSPQIAKMVMSAKLDPYECLLETLADERYNPVRAAMNC